MRRGRRGFTLVEAMVAVAVAAATVMMAAKLATVVTQQNSVGRQENDLSVRTRVLREQLLEDVRLAGMGSTGAIGVDPSVSVLQDLAVEVDPTGASGLVAIPAISGANNLPAIGLPTGTLQGGTDAIQLVVPNPGTRVRTVERARARSNILVVDDTSPIPAECALLYIHDHTNPNGSGRTQVAWVQSVGATQITVQGELMFTAAPQTEVMCGRISTYWLDDDGWLHRTDLGPDTALQLASAPVWVNGGPTEPDLMAPGISGLQIAYHASAEVFRRATTPQPVPADPDASWLFRGATPDVSGLFLAPDNEHLWFEIRLVRINVFARHLKTRRGQDGDATWAGVEDGDDVTIDRGFSGEWITFTGGVTNLRMFDSALAADVVAEPF